MGINLKRTQNMIEFRTGVIRMKQQIGKYDMQRAEVDPEKKRLPARK